MTADDPNSDFDSQISGIAALNDPTRRALYCYVVAQPAPVSRDQAAEGVGVARHIAKFHLDKLLEDGLLAVEFARAPGRRGPGAGRPAKLYSRSSRELAISLPQRDYALLGRLFAEAVIEAETTKVSIDDALADTSRTTGRSLGRRAREHAGEHPGPEALLDAATGVLRYCGYEPRSNGTDIALINCPFHALAQDYTDLVCGMNLCLMDGLVDTLQHPSLEAHLRPEPGRCCVLLTQPTALIDVEVSR
ncbi:MAG TPA: helix-turn-helix domain-containing protein [Ilumatobacteraceae bacterium]|nr:helix-turn-helix domain-containing protein [Ilumatobacteraceae bacterium]